MVKKHYKLILIFVVSVWTVYVLYQFEERAALNHTNKTITPSEDDAEEEMREHIADGSPYPSTKVIQDSLNAHVRDLAELDGRHSDYVIEQACQNNTEKPSQGRLAKFGFLGPFKYLKDYKNPCWLPRDSHRIMCVPYFYLIGTAKAGSTEIYSKIQAHPNVTMGRKKEVMWFQRERFSSAETFSDYLNYMSGAINLIKRNVNDSGFHGTIIGDGSTDLLMDNRHWPKFVGNEGCSEPRVTVMGHIHHLWPGAKLIFVIRNPATRALSCYLYFPGWKRQNNSGSAEQFDLWVRQSIDVWNNCVAKNTYRWCLYSFDLRNKFNIMQFEFNFYIFYLLDLLKVFPRDQVYITSLEAYSEDKMKTLSEIYQFLDLPPMSKDSLSKITAQKKLNAGKNYRKMPQMWNSTRKLLEDFFEPYNQKLWDIIGKSTPRKW